MHFGAVVFKRGFGEDVSSPGALRKLLADNSQWILTLGKHAVGLHCDSGTVFVIDASKTEVLTASPVVIIREIGRHDQITLCPIIFGSHCEHARISADDAARSFGAGRIFTEADFRSSEAFIQNVLRSSSSSTESLPSAMLSTCDVLFQFGILERNRICPKCDHGRLEDQWLHHG